MPFWGRCLAQLHMLVASISERFTSQGWAQCPGFSRSILDLPCPRHRTALLRQVWVVRHLDGMGDLVSLHGLRRRQSVDKQRSVEPSRAASASNTGELRRQCRSPVGTDPQETFACRKACRASAVLGLRRLRVWMSGLCCLGRALLEGLLGS